MDKLSEKKIKQYKTFELVETKMPLFAKRFFRFKKDSLTVESLYGYAIELTAFFDYLSSISYDVKSMTISDLETITPEIIENYIEASRSMDLNGIKIARSSSSLKHRISALSSFYGYFYKMDMIDRNPIHKIDIPRQKCEHPHIPAPKETAEILDFVANGSLTGVKSRLTQHLYRKRDTALILLLIGAGLKVSECHDLDIDDLHLDESYIFVRNRESKRIGGKVFLSESISSAISEYLSERLEIKIPYYGHEKALFLSTQKKRITVRGIEKLTKKYISALYGESVEITPMDLSLSFRENIFEQSKSIEKTSSSAGICRKHANQIYRPALDEYEPKKPLQFNAK